MITVTLYQDICDKLILADDQNLFGIQHKKITFHAQTRTSYLIVAVTN